MRLWSCCLVGAGGVLVVACVFCTGIRSDVVRSMVSVRMVGSVFLVVGMVFLFLLF